MPPCLDRFRNLTIPHKKILKFADDSEPVSIQHQDAALVSFVGRLASNPSEEDGPIFQTEKNWWVVVGDKDVVPALEMGIRFTECGETTAIWSHSKFAYGQGIRSDSLPANANVRYEVIVHKIWTAEELDQSRVKLEVCRSKKIIANDIYQNEDVANNPQAKSRALHIYKKAAEQLEYLLRQSAGVTSVEDGNAELDFDMQDARNLLLDCLNNIAAVHLRCKSYHAAKESCVSVLQHDPQNFKALVRAAKAALLDPASSFDEVEAAIKAASEQTQDDGKLKIDVQRLEMDLLRRKQVHKQREKTMYSKMTQVTGNSLKEKDNSSEERKPGETYSYIHHLKQLPWVAILLYAFVLILLFAMYHVRKNEREIQGDGSSESREASEL